MGAKGGPKTGGRRKGTKNKKDAIAQALFEEAARSDETPLQHFLAILRDPSEDKTRRFEAARAAAPYVHPKALVVAGIGEDGQPVAGGGLSLQLYLPHNHRDDALMVETGRLTQGELDRYHEAERYRLVEVERLDEELRQWVRSGKMTNEAARLARSQRTKPGDPIWVPVEPPAPPPRALSWHSAPLAANGTAAEESPIEIEGNIDFNEIELPAKTVLYSCPNTIYQIGKGYYADRFGQIADVEAEDVEALIRAGCRRTLGRAY
jgi:hypothetical protein